MEVLALISEQHPETTLDIFVTEPFNFNHEYENSNMVQLDQNLNVRIISIQTLIDMKNNVGRDRDKDDIKHLTWILDNTNEQK